MATCLKEASCRKGEHVMSDKFSLDVVQAAELKYAFERNGYTNADVKTLSSGNMLGKVLGVIRGTMEIVLRKLLTWRKVTVGVHGSVATLKQALIDNKFNVSDYASQILEKMKVSKVAIELELVVLSVAELGFTNGATFAQIVEQAKQLELDLCPAEVGPVLRLVYKDQLRGEWLLVAMEPIADSDGRSSVFDVDHDGDGLCLCTGWFDPGLVWRLGSRWVFIWPRK